ncbi:MAG: hypothetical protein ABIR87_07015 [Sphingomicrobium sp.]
MPAVDRATRFIARLGLLSLAALLAWHACRFVANSIRAVRDPYELDYGEGIVWFQTQQLFAGKAYGDIHHFPAVVFHYTPLFHFLSGLGAAMGFDGLAAGRTVSLLSTAAMVVMIGAIVRHVLLQSQADRRTANICAVVGGLTLLLAYPVKFWAPMMRVDMLAFALALAGVYAALRAIRQPRWIHAAAAFFVASVFAKQTMVAAPGAVFLVLLVYRPRTALAGIATCLVAGLIAVAALTYATHGGFLAHVFLYNINRFDVGRIDKIEIITLSHLFLVIVALIGVGISASAVRRFVAQRRTAAPPDVAAAMLVAYLLLTTIMLLLVLKLGSSANYFIEWFAVLAIFVGIALRDPVATALGGKPLTSSLPSPIGMFAVFGLCAQSLMITPTQYPAEYFAARAPAMARLTDMVRNADGPVISDDMVVLLRSGRPVLWEPAIFTELAATGGWDERPFIKLIEQRKFPLIIVFQARGDKLFSQRFSPAVGAAIERSYTRQEKVAGFTIHRPR